jgi:signal transduction histidine kinase
MDHPTVVEHRLTTTQPDSELALLGSLTADSSHDDVLAESRREGQSLILLRYVLIAAAAYLFLFEGETASPAVIASVIAIALLSNVLLAHGPDKLLTHPLTVGTIVCVDIGWIAFGLWYKGEFGSDIFFLYFFVLFLAAMGQRLALIVGAAALISVMDLAFFVRPGQGQSVWTSPSLIRVPFLFTVSLFYGYLTDRWKREHRWALFEEEFSQKLAQIVRQQTQHLQRMYDQAKAQATELEKVTRVKNEFLSVMSHELRTPLSAMMGYTALIKDGTTGAVTREQENMLNQVLVHSSGLLSMINSILQVTSMESHELRAEGQEVRLTDFLKNLRAAYDTPLKAGITLLWDYPRETQVMHVDGEKLRQILQNLIDNAIKFTPAGSVSITARYFPSTETVEFKVADTGIGISREELPLIFEMFRQGDSSETRLYGGVGLGLYIVNKLNQLLGGTITVESEPGKGSTFTVRIPVPKIAGGPQP